MNTALVLFGAVAAGMLVQAFTTYKQTTAFSASVRALRKHGEVAVGGAGKRYRGGKGFVAIAADPQGRVTKAVSLTGWTTFARPRVVDGVQGLSLSRLRGDAPLPMIDPRVRTALQNAAQSLSKYQAKSKVA